MIAGAEGGHLPAVAANRALKRLRDEKTINRADAPFGGIPTRDPGQLRVRLSERMRGGVGMHASEQRERALPPHRELARHDRRVVQPR